MPSPVHKRTELLKEQIHKISYVQKIEEYFLKLSLKCFFENYFRKIFLKNAPFKNQKFDNSKDVKRLPP